MSPYYESRIIVDRPFPTDDMSELRSLCNFYGFRMSNVLLHDTSSGHRVTGSFCGLCISNSVDLEVLSTRTVELCSLLVNNGFDSPRYKISAIIIDSTGGCSYGTFL